MEHTTLTNTVTPLTPIIQFKVDFEQIWNLVQQLTDEKRIELLDRLQADLEAAKLIKPRTDEDQRRNYIPLTKPNRPDYNKPKFSKEDAMKWWDEESQEPELDANLTDKELLEMIKDI